MCVRSFLFLLQTINDKWLLRISMAAAVMPRTEPNHVQRPRIIFVMTVNIRTTARPAAPLLDIFARTPDKCTYPNGVLNLGRDSASLFSLGFIHHDGIKHKFRRLVKRPFIAYTWQMASRDPNRKRALRRAIAAAGGLDRIAKPLGITMQAVSSWKEVPPLRVLAVEKISGVSRHELRPDLYPVE
jgi:hypothetical protein